MANGIDRRIFVVGAPRSGTTLVQSLLATHGAVTSFTESHFFSRHFRLVPGLSMAILVRSPMERVRDFLAENQIDTGRAVSVLATVAALTRTGTPLPFRTRAVARQLLELLDRLTLERGRSSWIEKTPKHLRFIPFLERISSPDSRTHFVHVIRDGIEVVASLHLASQSWERPYDLETCVQRWNDDVAFSLGRISSASDHFVFYEDLTSEPAAAVRRLLSELDLDWQPGMLDRFAETANRLVTQGETWKQNVGRPVRRSATAARALTRDQLEQAEAALCSDLYGGLYEAVRSRRPVAAR